MIWLITAYVKDAQMLKTYEVVASSKKEAIYYFRKEHYDYLITGIHRKTS